MVHKDQPLLSFPSLQTSLGVLRSPVASVPLPFNVKTAWFNKNKRHNAQKTIFKLYCNFLKPFLLHLPSTPGDP